MIPHKIMLYQIYSVLYQFGDNFSYLILSALGLAIIFGMMGVINLAHGELIMCGAYVTISVAKQNIPLPIAMACGIIASGVAGFFIERLFICHLYTRLYDSVVATWAISLIVQQSMLLIVGPSISGISTPLGAFTYGGISYSTYRAVLPLVALLMLAALYLLFFHTNYGVMARATIENSRIAASLGIRTTRIYSGTFILGAALAGFAGAIYAPTMTAVPTMGQSFIVQAFVTVVVGGTNILIGAAPAAALLAAIQTILTSAYGQLAGQIGLLCAAIIAIRLLPNGINSFFLKTR